MLDLLQHLLDLHHVLSLTGRKLPDQLISSIGNLACALKLVTHPDGALALFNDLTEDESSAVIMTLMRAGATGAVERDLIQLPQTGFHRMSAGRSVLISDAGAPPPHGLDGHAHAGTLSFEFSHGMERMIVNCGAHPIAEEWRAGPARDRGAFRAGGRRHQLQHAAAVWGPCPDAALRGGAARADRSGAMAGRAAQRL